MPLQCCPYWKKHMHKCTHEVPTYSVQVSTMFGWRSLKMWLWLNEATKENPNWIWLCSYKRRRWGLRRAQRKEAVNTGWEPSSIHQAEGPTLWLWILDFQSPGLWANKYPSVQLPAMVLWLWQPWQSRTQTFVLSKFPGCGFAWI